MFISFSLSGFFSPVKTDKFWRSLNTHEELKYCVIVITVRNSDCYVSEWFCPPAVISREPARE
jgi:hypothetical protein